MSKLAETLKAAKEMGFDIPDKRGPSLEDALLFIADRCDGAHSTDGQGFNKLDATFGKAMAGKVRSGKRLSVQEYKDAYAMLKKYNKQLVEKQMDIRLIPKEQPETDEEQPSNQPEVEEIPGDAEKAALRIAERGKPLKFMLRTFHQTHKGDKLHAKSQFISFGQQSAINTKGNFDNWEGPSGKGKSDAVKACVRQLPGEYAITSSITSKSLYHRAKGGGVLPGSVLHLDDKNVQAGSDLEETLKRAQTFFQEGAEHETVDGKGNYQRVQLPPRLLVIRTCVNSSDSDAQLKNRSVSHGVDSSKDTDKAVCDLVLKLGEDGQTTDMITRQTMICKALWRDIKSGLYRVVTPASGKLIEFSDVSNRRNPSLFLDMVKGITCIHHRQRISVDGPNGERILYANYEDYLKAAELFNSQGEYLGSRLDKAEFAAVQYIKDQGTEGATINGIFYHLAEKFPNDGWNGQKVRRLMDGRPERGDQGLADTVPGIGVRWMTNDKGSNTKFYVVPGELSLGVQVAIHDPRTKNVSCEDLSHLSHRSPTLGKELINSIIPPIPTSYPKYPNKEKDREGKERVIEDKTEPKVCSKICGVDFGKTGKTGQPNEPIDSEKAVFPDGETVGIGGKTGIGPHPRRSEPTPSRQRVKFRTDYDTDLDGEMRHLIPGDVAEVPADRAATWIKRGVAEAT